MKTTMGKLIIISLLVGSSHAYAANMSSDIPNTTESHDQHLTNQPTSITRIISRPLSSDVGAFQERVAPNYENEATSETPVTALPDLIVRSPSAIRGVQCPIPPVLKHIPLQETHP